jgi:hypothetical protein
MQDPTTLFEEEVLTLLKSSEEYVKRLEKPMLIGPDRDTVQHTVNTLQSYGPSLKTEISKVRPDYRTKVDIIGTQARYPDNSARLDNFKKLTQGQIVPVWCTLGAQEWDRLMNADLVMSAEPT